MIRPTTIGLLALGAMLVALLSGCVATEAGSMNPDFAGSMKLQPGLIPPPTPLGELPGSRVREGD